jgi:hypothetical protein
MTHKSLLASVPANMYQNIQQQVHGNVQKPQVCECRLQLPDTDV